MSGLERRDDLLEQVVDYVCVHGVGTLSLRPLAAAVGTSARMLVYHFGSKEQLVSDALDAVRRRQHAQVEKWIAEAEGLPFRELMTRFWLSSASAESAAYGRLFFEAYGIALMDRDQLPRFLDGAVGGWVGLLRTALTGVGISADDADSIATAALAVHRGLLLDLFATGDRERVDRAHHYAMGVLELDVTQRLPTAEDGST